MITYDEYFAQSQRVISAARELPAAALTLSEINCTGLRTVERYWKYAGIYLANFAIHANIADQEEQDILLMRSAQILIAAIFMLDPYSDLLDIFTPDEMKEDPSELSLFEARMADCSRLTPITYLGNAAMFSLVPIYPDSEADYVAWFTSQLQNMNDYCITHNVDLVHIIQLIAAKYAQ